MTPWAEINRLKHDPVAAKDLADRLLRLNVYALSPWETKFLGDAQTWAEDESLSTRRVEKLVQIRDNVERVAKCRGFSVRSLIRGCYEARADLDEEDEAWIVELRAEDADRVRRRELSQLMRCARVLGIVEGS